MEESIRMSAPFRIINRDTVTVDAVENPAYIALQFIDKTDGKPIFMGTIPTSYLPPRPTDKDANDLLSAILNPGNGLDLFDMMQTISPDPRMSADIRGMVISALIEDTFPPASSIVSNAGIDSDGEFMDTDKIATDLSTLLVAMDIPRNLEEAEELVANEIQWRFKVGGSSLFFGYRWYCIPQPSNDNTSTRLQYSSDDDSWAGPWRLFITAVYPPDQLD